MLRRRVRRYCYIARKYWAMNPLRLWWVGHVADEIRADLQRTPFSHKTAISKDLLDRPKMLDVVYGRLETDLLGEMWRLGYYTDRIERHTVGTTDEYGHSTIEAVVSAQGQRRPDAR